MSDVELPVSEPYEDPILAEVRRARREYFAECGNDMKRMLEDIRRRQAEHPERVVSFPPRPAQQEEPERKKSA